MALKHGRRISLAVALIGAALYTSAPAVALAQAAGAPVPPPNVPAALQVTDGSVLLLRGFAVGTQVYDCQVTNTASGTATWVFRQPRATLVGDDGEPLGIHGLGPFWAAYDGTSVVGSAPVSAPGRDPAHDVPLLLLHGTPAGADGRFATVTWIQRLDTRGGAAPTGPCDPAQQPSLAVPYEAVYYFYGP
jgi:hypothetical protein